MARQLLRDSGAASYCYKLLLRHPLVLVVVLSGTIEAIWIMNPKMGGILLIDDHRSS
jgi:hypothetical protein